jgi:hypothetical protein
MAQSSKVVFVFVTYTKVVGLIQALNGGFSIGEKNHFNGGSEPIFNLDDLSSTSPELGYRHLAWAT